jgi:uncharacterized protein (DUF1778 family)
VGALVKNWTDSLESPLDHTDFAVDPETYSAFLTLLDAPKRPNVRLCRSLQMHAPWEK